MSRLSKLFAAAIRRSPPCSRGRRDGISIRRSARDWRSGLDEPLLRQLERLSLDFPALRGQGRPGERRSRVRAPGGEPVDQRPYSAGDDFRQIDWPASARLERLVVKVSEARLRSTVYLLLDCSDSMRYGDPPKLDLARQLVAALGYVALARFDRVQLLPLGGPAGRMLEGKRSFPDLLVELDRAQGPGALSLSQAVNEQRLADGPGIGIVASDLLFSDGWQEGFDQLARRGLTLAALQVLAREELAPEAGGDALLVDVETGERVAVGLTPTTLATYRQRLDSWCSQVARYCLRRGWPWLQLCADEPLSQSVLVRGRQSGLLR